MKDYTKRAARLVVGRRIERVELNEAPNGNGGTLYYPVLHLDNGARIRFAVDPGYENCDDDIAHPDGTAFFYDPPARGRARVKGVR